MHTHTHICIRMHAQAHTCQCMNSSRTESIDRNSAWPGDGHLERFFMRITQAESDEGEQESLNFHQD